MMAHLRYTASNKTENEGAERQLFSVYFLGSIFIAIVLVLIYLYPGEQLENQLLEEKHLTDVDFFYSLILLEKANDTTPITLDRINTEPQAVIEQLDLYSQSKDPKNLWFHYIVLRNISYDKKLSKANKVFAEKVMTHYFKTFLNSPITEGQQHQLAIDSLAIDEQQYALQFYDRLIAENPNRSVQFYARAGQVALWANQCEKSANYYFKAKDLSDTIDDKRYFYFQAIKTLYSCEKYKLALDLAATHLDGLSADSLTYQLLVDFAIKGDQPGVAEGYIIKSLELDNLILKN